MWRWRGGGGSKGGNETGGDGDGDREDRHTVVGAVGGASGVVAAAMAWHVESSGFELDHCCTTHRRPPEGGIAAGRPAIAVALQK